MVLLHEMGGVALSTLLMNTLCAQPEFNTRYKLGQIYHFDDTVKVTRDNIFTTYKNEFGLGVDDEMEEFTTIADGDNIYTHYHQKYKNIRVAGGDMKSIGKCDVIYYLSGQPVRGLSIPIVGTLTESEALQIALDYIDAEEYLWENTEYINQQREEQGDPSYTPPPPTGRQIIQNLSGDTAAAGYGLYWKFRITSTVPLSETEIYIDQNNAMVTETSPYKDEAYHLNNGKVYTWFDGTHTDMGVIRQQFPINKYGLNSNKGVSTSLFGSGIYIQDDDNDWGELSMYGVTDRKTAASAHWAAENAKEYYLDRFSRWGSDYQGKQYKVYIENNQVGAVETGVTGNGQDMIVVAPDSEFGTSLASLDVISHEYTHSIINHGDPDYQGTMDDWGEAGAIEEGMCDVHGYLIERHILGRYNWQLGENSMYTRFIHTPNLDQRRNNASSPWVADPSAARYFGPFWRPAPTTRPPGGDNTRHANGGVYRQWFDLLAHGGNFNGHSLQGKGLNTAEGLSYTLMNWWVWHNMNFVDLANQSFHMGEYYYGCDYGNDLIRAWNAVDVPAPVRSCKWSGIKSTGVLFPDDLAGAGSITIEKSDALAGADVLWTVPNSWTTHIDANQHLVIDSVPSLDSRYIELTYIDSDGTVYQEKRAIHFCSTHVAGDNTLPPSPSLAKSVEETDEAKTVGLQIYPNPTESYIIIELDDHVETRWTIQNLLGQIVESGKFHSTQELIDIQHLSQGQYIMTVIYGHNQKSQIITKL